MTEYEYAAELLGKDAFLLMVAGGAIVIAVAIMGMVASYMVLGDKDDCHACGKSLLALYGVCMFLFAIMQLVAVGLWLNISGAATVRRRGARWWRVCLSMRGAGCG